MYRPSLLYLGVCLLSGILTGSSSITYQEPKSGPVGRVRFATAGARIPTVVRGYHSKACDGEYDMMMITKGAVLNSESKRLGIPLWRHHKNAAKEFLVTAGLPHVYMFESIETIAYHTFRCAVFLQQTFKENKDYELDYHHSIHGCHIKVYELKKDTVGEVEKVLLQQKDSRLPSDFSKACLARFHRAWWR